MKLKKIISIITVISIFLTSFLVVHAESREKNVYKKNTQMFRKNNPISVKHLGKNKLKGNGFLAKNFSFNLNDSNKLNKHNDNVMTIINKGSYDKTLQKNAKNQIKKSLKSEFDNQKYILFYGDYENLNSENLDSEISDVLDIGFLGMEYTDKNKELVEKAKKDLFALGYYKTSGGATTIQFFYGEEKATKDINKNLDFIYDSYNHVMTSKEEKKYTGKNSKLVKPQISFDDYDHRLPFYKDYGRKGIFAGVTYLDRVAKNSKESVWDVRGRNTTYAGWGQYTTSFWVTDEVIARYSVQGFANQDLIDFSPDSSIKSGTNSLTLGMSAEGPNVSWTHYFGGVDVNMDCSEKYNYGRWIYEYPIGLFYPGVEAREKYTSRPAARFTNTRGKFGIKISHKVTFLETMSAMKSSNLLPQQTTYWKDR